MAKEIKKIILAYSGGLDTSIIIPWLHENYPGCEVICVAGNVGQDAEIVGLEERAKKTGASKLYIEDIQDEFVNDFVFPTIKAGAKYEGYLLGTSFARPPIAKRLVEIAKKEGADAICHGCTGKGNDQVRFEASILMLDPDIEIIAPVREWDLHTRSEEMEWAQAHGIEVPTTKKSPYSIDDNLWGRAIECGVLEDPWMEPPTDIYTMTESHLAAMLANFPEHADKIRLVTCYTDNRNISDPIGCGQAAYNNVARQLTDAIRAIIARMEQEA